MTQLKHRAISPSLVPSTKIELSCLGGDYITFSCAGGVTGGGLVGGTESCTFCVIVSAPISVTENVFINCPKGL